MELTGTQRLLARLFTDETLRNRFFADPAAIGEELGLAPEDARKLAAISQRQLTTYSQTLLRKRLGDVRRLLPRTTRQLGGQFESLFERHAAQFLPHGIHRHADDAQAFARFLAQSVANGEVSRVVADLARYEATWLEYRQGRRLPCARMFCCDPREAGKDDVLVKCTTLAVWFRFGRRVRHFVVRRG